MTVRDSRTQARARTPGAEDNPTSTTVRDRTLGPTQCGISDVATKCTKGGRKPNICRCMLGSSLKLAMSGKAPSEMSALQPYWGKPAAACGVNRGAAQMGAGPYRRAISRVG